MIDTNKLNELKDSMLLFSSSGINVNSEKYIKKHDDHLNFLDLLGIGTGICDFETGKYSFISEKFRQIFSIEKQVKADIYSIISRLTSEDISRVTNLISKGYRFIAGLQPKQQNGCEMRLFYRVGNEKTGFKWIMQSSRFIREANQLFEIICINIGCEDQMEPPLYLNISYGTNRKCINYEGNENPALNFSEREKEVFFWSVKAYSVKQISERLFISEATVRFHRKNILAKMGMKNFIQVMNYHQNGKRG